MTLFQILNTLKVNVSLICATILGSIEISSIVPVVFFFYRCRKDCATTIQGRMYEYEEVPLCELTFDLAEQKLRYPCPCGDLFEMLLADLIGGKDIAQCPTCSLTIKVLYNESERLAFLDKYQLSMANECQPILVTA